ncbi:Outer membrane protein oprM precursor [Leminorella grimontii]|uniref:TolC family protein n=1 Tax=Leminorella grimontii TaxID=82981 RepID=UPI00106CD0A6|nr:TolC family protein [Leminorella grimontii]VFS54662.1 Outer membrane protein oprM precursor [Leminorella grimontii]
MFEQSELGEGGFSVSERREMEQAAKRDSRKASAVPAAQRPRKAITTTGRDGKQWTVIDTAEGSETNKKSDVLPRQSLYVKSDVLDDDVIRFDVEDGAYVQSTDAAVGWSAIDSASFSPEDSAALPTANAKPARSASPSSKSKGGLGGDSPSRGFIRTTVVQALNFSPEVGNAMASSTAARYDIDQVKGQRWPQVKVGVSSPMSSFGEGTRNDYASDVGDTSGSVSVTTRIYDFGKTSSTISSAEESFNASQHTIRLTRNQIAFETISGLLELDKYRKEIDVAKAYEARMASLVNMLQQIVQTDVGRSSELVQARSKLLQAKTNVQQIETKWRDTQIRLTRLLGRNVNLPVNLKWDDSQVDAGSVLYALNDHPQILRAKAQVQASLHSADALESSMYPNINWVVAKSNAKDSSGVEQAWYTGINVEWDLFTGGSASASQKAALQRAQASRKEFEATVLELKYRIRSMVEQRNSSFARAKDYRALSAETDRVRTMFYEQWYYLGKRSLLDVLTAENDHFNNQVAAINQQFDGYTANINILAESALLLDWLSISMQ